MTRSLLFASLSLACGVAQFVLMLGLRPDAARLAALKPGAEPETPEPTPPGAFERIGRSVLGLLGGRRGGAATPAEARSVGAACVFAACLLPFSPLVAVVGGAVGWITPRLIQTRTLKAREAAILDDLPEAVDLLVLGLGAGLNVPLAVDAVGRRGTGPLSAEMALAAEANRRGQPLADALDEVATRCGEQVRPLMSLLASGERYGVPLGESLDRLAVDVRAARRRQAEEAARRLPVKMLFPLVVCILPAFALLTLGPLLLTSFRDLAW